ncbi:unnamed protein product [Litomosoides sigmodontis]|uniref:Phosphorylated adapter RNA export protein n=1 Tax=Litomosoides sigmodontis TaxID=42156 RepID=A0A3P6T143_LITSI|nr:unnamed protein product [Litomosoides sigmodontis]
MYRVKESCDESSSDEEDVFLVKKQKLSSDSDSMTNCKAGSKAAQMWTDLLAEQSLSETFSDKVGVHRGENDMVERGVESYVIPDARCTSNDQEIGYQKDRVISPDSNCSGPFDFIADEERIKSFPDKHERYSRRRDDELRNGNGRRSIYSINQKKNIGKSWKNCASVSRSTSRGSTKRKRNNYGASKKRGNQIAKRVGNANRNPRSQPSDDYSLEGLLAAEFPENISIVELAERIVTALGERNGKFLQSVILEIGEEKALELFEATRGIEASGGMMIADGTRRRTPGGVFMTLFKTDPDILPVLKEKICNLQRATAREIRTAKRRGKGEASEVEMLKKLSTASEVLLEKSQLATTPLT